ncbi:MAG: hypothetical protein MHPDNHAH_00651 [Anaerolineales bacterium]|nr:hypothetical protein [Anaerolineales bacterium]
MSKEKITISDKLGIILAPLSILGGLATIVGCILAFLTFVSPKTITNIVYAIYPQPTTQPQVVIVTVPPQPTYTPLPTYTLQPAFVQPTIPTKTPVPTSTVFVPPADGILFQDSFDAGIKPEWKKLSGQWLVAEGRLTLLPDGDFDFEWISLEKTEWKNYKLSINVNVPNTNSNDSVVISLRRNGSESIGIFTDWVPRIYWAFVGTAGSSTTPVTSSRNAVDFPEGQNNLIEVEVNGDNYSVKLNGRNLESLALSGYDLGDISIGTSCHDTYTGCPSFDDIKVTYLP